MAIREVKRHMGRTVYYDTRQLNIDGCSSKDFILTACILRKKNNGPLYYQAELTDTNCKNSVIIVPLEKVLTKDKI